MPATDEVTVNTTSRPSTNESAAATSHTDAGAAKGKRRRARSGRMTSAIAGAANQRDVPRLRRVMPEGDLERRFDRREHDEGVEAIPAREGHEAAHALNVLQALGAPPPTWVGGRIVGWDERGSGLATRPVALPRHSVGAWTRPRKDSSWKPRPPSLHARRESSRSRSSLSSLAVSPTFASRPAQSRSRCPKGRRPATSSLEDCTYATEDGSYAADCGTLVVPENRPMRSPG